MRILVVEDDDLVRALAVEMLADEGFEVVEAASAEECFACWDGTADVLFTDIRLPGTLTGWDIAERCRKDKPNIPVVYATGFSDEVPRPVPGSILLHKPYRPQDMTDAIRKVARSI